MLLFLLLTSAPHAAPYLPRLPCSGPTRRATSKAAQALAQDLFDALDDDLKPLCCCWPCPPSRPSPPAASSPTTAACPPSLCGRRGPGPRHSACTTPWPYPEREDMSPAMLRRKHEGLGVRDAVQEVLDALDEHATYQHFAGWPVEIDGYFVVTVLRLQRKPLRAYPSLRPHRFYTDGRPLALVAAGGGHVPLQRGGREGAERARARRGHLRAPPRKRGTAARRRQNPARHPRPGPGPRPGHHQAVCHLQHHQQPALRGRRGRGQAAAGPPRPPQHRGSLRPHLPHRAHRLPRRAQAAGNGHARRAPAGRRRKRVRPGPAGGPLRRRARGLVRHQLRDALRLGAAARRPRAAALALRPARACRARASAAPASAAPSSAPSPSPTRPK